MKKRTKNILLILTIPALAILSFILWADSPYQPMEQTATVAMTDKLVAVSTDKWLTYAPAHKEATTGFIFYPGARVAPRAYEPMAKALASAGYQVVIVPMPLNLAVFGINRADQVMATYPKITNWVIGGHSLGGAMAASYVYKNPDKIAGIVFLASYPGKSADLSASDLKVLSIYGTNDGLATMEKIDNTRQLVPQDTHWVEIKGGNHSQFGWYGFQSGDGEAAISRKEQQNIIIDSISEFLQEISE